MSSTLEEYQGAAQVPAGASYTVFAWETDGLGSTTHFVSTPYIVSAASPGQQRANPDGDVLTAFGKDLFAKLRRIEKVEPGTHFAMPHVLLVTIKPQKPVRLPEIYPRRQAGKLPENVCAAIQAAISTHASKQSA